tara:strand:- start:457 stop:747 length:291 start_codon:yes stop_codon:yes gene_type:complete
MFGLGFGEILFVLVIALLVLGPEKLPKLAKTLGKGMREFRRAAAEFQQGFNEIEQEANRTLEEPPALQSGESPKDGANQETVARDSTLSEKSKPIE